MMKDEEEGKGSNGRRGGRTRSDGRGGGKRK